MSDINGRVAGPIPGSSCPNVEVTLNPTPVEVLVVLLLFFVFLILAS